MFLMIRIRISQPAVFKLYKTSDICIFINKVVPDKIGKMQPLNG